MWVFPVNPVMSEDFNRILKVIVNSHTCVADGNSYAEDFNRILKVDFYTDKGVFDTTSEEDFNRILKVACQPFTPSASIFIFT